MAALTLVGAMMTGCSNDDDSIIDTPQQTENKSNVVTLTTTVGIGGGAETRALTAGGVKTFAAGEQLALIYKNMSDETVKAVSAALTAGDITNDGKNATFTFELENPDRTQNVTYIYPAAMANSDGSINYAALNSQNGTLATLASNLDLATYSGAWNAGTLPTGTLTNQLAILAINLKNEAGSSDITSSITGMTINDGTNTYIVSPSSLSTIYVAIRPTTSANIDITANDGSTVYTKSLTGKTYEAGNGYNVSWRMAPAAPAGAINGKFSVSSTKQVYFSKGNLQATYNGSSWSWAFATNQWDYIGNAAGNTSINGNGTVSANNVTVDLFGWVGASNTTWTGAAQYGITSSTATNSTEGYGNGAKEALKSDWGNTIGSGWRTLTSAEWQYVFKTRNGATSVNGTANARYTHATINTDGTGVNGMILFPDGVTIANGEATSWGTINGNSEWGTQCTSAQWTALAAKGCVFLPAAGLRDGSSVSDAGSNGHYWSSSPYTSSALGANRVLFASGNLNAENYYIRRFGLSVRLVRQVE